MWEGMRDGVLDVFPPPPGLPQDREQYLQFVDDLYRSDAHHSLSIEGYTVSAELIDRVRAGNWHPGNQEADRQDRDALAARGYWQAFQSVKQSVAGIIGGANPGGVVRTSHREWYRELFQPCVASGLIAPGALAGSRNDAVYLRTSRYVPPRWEAVRDAMPALFDLLESEKEPGVRAVLGALDAGLYSSVSRWRRADLPLPDECHAGFRRLPVDGDPRGPPCRLSGSPGQRRHRFGYRPLRPIYSRARALVDGVYFALRPLISECRSDSCCSLVTGLFPTTAEACCSRDPFSPLAGISRWQPRHTLRRSICSRVSWLKGPAPFQ